MVFDLAVTPDRGYCMSVRGIAREIACAYDLDFVDPADIAPLPVEGPSLPVTVQPGTGVIRFALRPVTGIDPGAQSPWWLRRRLMLSGIRPISPAVDVTNYVMLELGHPMHAHDSSRIRGDFAVRFAHQGTVVTLDDVERRLDPGDVLIVDDAAVAAIGGVMGRAPPRSTRPPPTCCSRRRSGIRPRCPGPSADCIWSARPAAATSVRSTRPSRWPPSTAVRRCSPDRRRHRAASAHRLAGRSAAGRFLAAAGADGRRSARSHRGVTYPDGATLRRLTQIGARVQAGQGAELIVTPPSWRPDIVQPADLVEEVLRLESLEVIPSMLPAAPAGRGLTAAQQRRRAVGKALALSGFVEVLPTPFLPAGVFDQWGLPAQDPRRATAAVLNPLEADRPELATTLLPALLEALSRNVSRGFGDVALFSVAQVVRPTEDTRAVERIPTHRRPTDAEIALLDSSLPHQPVHVGAVLCGLREPRGPWGPGRPVEAADAFEAVRVIARACGVAVTLRPAQHLPWHPGRCAEVLVDSVVVGHAGQLHPGVVERAGLPKGSCAVELDLDAVPIVESLPAPPGVAVPRGVPGPEPGRRRRGAGPGRHRRGARRGRGTPGGRGPVRRLHRPAGRGGPQVADVGAALPRRRPDPRRGRGQLGPRCGTGDRRRTAWRSVTQLICATRVRLRRGGGFLRGGGRG